MKEFRPVLTVEELLQLDQRDLSRGFRAGQRGLRRPTSACSRGYWHGWRNGMVRAGRQPPSADMEFLHSDLSMKVLRCPRLQ